MTPRDVPLGGPRAMTVRRTLPQRERSLIGAWCFLDHYGPDHVTDTGGMSVAPHPHTGLQTVRWLFTGEIEHRDSAGHHAMVRPGELNLMTAGHGISHSEVSTPETSVLHGAQLWVALPDVGPRRRPDVRPLRARRGDRRRAGRRGSSSARCSATPRRSRPPRRCSAPSCCSSAGTELHLDVDPAFEHGVLVDTGVVSRRRRRDQAARARLRAARLAAARPSRPSPTARVLLLGGPPFGEAIVMWWNFVGRSHEEVVAFREAWQAQLADDGYADGRFGIPIGDDHAADPGARRCPTPGSRNAADRCRRRRSGCSAWVRGR